MPSGRRGQIKRVDGRRRASTSVDGRRRASRDGRRRTSTDVDALGVNGPYHLILTKIVATVFIITLDWINKIL